MEFVFLVSEIGGSHFSTEYNNWQEHNHFYPRRDGLESIPVSRNHRELGGVAASPQLLDLFDAGQVKRSRIVLVLSLSKNRDE